jgi:DNA-binding response OmpR family regulator
MLRCLVVDANANQRHLMTSALRAWPNVEIEHATTTEQCLALVESFGPDLIIADWVLPDGKGTELTKRLRLGEAGNEYKRVPVIIVSAYSTASDLDHARNAGIDEFLARPFTISGLIARIEAVRRNRREFVESASYVGPCRRRRMLQDYGGPKRRLFDAAAHDVDPPALQVKKGLARMYVERVGSLMTDRLLERTELNRQIACACAELHALAKDIGDQALATAAGSILNYVRGVGANAPLSPEIVKIHLDALVQLIEMPNAEQQARTVVAKELDALVRKKLQNAFVGRGAVLCGERAAR